MYSAYGFLCLYIFNRVVYYLPDRRSLMDAIRLSFDFKRESSYFWSILIFYNKIKFYSVVCIYAIPLIIFPIKHSNIASNFTWLLTILCFIQHARACSYSRRRRIRHIRFVVFRISDRAHIMHTSYYNAAVNYSIINVISVFFLSLGSGRKWRA